jgi:hypothetical protein
MTETNHKELGNTLWSLVDQFLGVTKMIRPETSQPKP